MKFRSPLVKGTVLLTLSGMFSRLIGFFYRVFLSKAFGAEAIGLFQLTAPVWALSFSLTAAGLQTAISKYVAECSCLQDRKPHHVLFAGLFLSGLISLFCAIGIYTKSDWLAAQILRESRCAVLLRILAFSLPLASIHSCFNGYFYGRKHTKIPAASQILEQLARVATVFVLYGFYLKQGITPGIALTAVGSVAGEAVSCFFSLFSWYWYLKRRQITFSLSDFPLAAFCSYTGKLVAMSTPLVLTRIVLNLLQSYEAIQIPLRLQQYGMTATRALELYGILTGMSLPLILFPNVLTGSVSVLLLPTISSAQAAGNRGQITTAIRKCILYSLFIGFAATCFFLGSGQFLGTFLFNEPLAGTYILALGFLCPFLYVSTTLTSILHGLGRTSTSFLLHVSSMVIRLLFVFYGIPLWGIQGYLWGLLAGEIYCAGACLLALRGFLYYNEP